jgi:hypothetical protein
MILVFVIIAIFSIDNISIDDILPIAIILAFVTVAGGFILAAVVQLAKSAGETMAKEEKTEEN